MSLEITKDIDRSAFFKRSPELLGVVAGVRFYECAIHGDERPLIAVTDSACGYSTFWELPEPSELLD